MTDYTPIEDYTAKDALTPGDADKVIAGSEIDGELDAISSAVNSKINLPTSPNTDDVLTWSGSAWVASSSASVTSIPVGVILPYGGSSAPSGDWLICNGASIDTTTYADLFAAIAYTYGGAGASFNIPDLRGKIPVGLDTSTFTPLGDTGGAETVTLTTTTLPAHSHTQGSLVATSDGAHTHDVQRGATSTGTDNAVVGLVDAVAGLATDPGGAHTHPVVGQTDGAGSGSAHDNLQPYIVTNYIIRAL